MLVPILVFIGCFGVGSAASARWLPNLPEGPFGGIAFFLVCGLLGGALSLTGLHIYSVVHEIHGLSRLGLDKAEIVAVGMRNILWEAGSLVGFAGTVFLLSQRLNAPPPTV